MNIRRESKRSLFALLLCVLIMISSVYVYADTRYVSDRLIITMREGTGNEYKIIKTLKTGTPLEVLEERDDYYKVITEDGKEGWVLKRYITSDVPKPAIIAGLKSEIEKLKKRIGKLAEERDALKKDMQSVKSEHKGQQSELEKSVNEKSDQISDLTRQLQDITNKYNKFVKDAGDVVKIVSERDMLKEENERISTERNDLLQENERLFERNVIYWFLAGGFVFFFGWIAGKISRKKKRYY